MGEVLVLTNEAALKLSEALAALKMVKEGEQQTDPLILTQVSSESVLPAQSSSKDLVVVICKSTEFLNNQLAGDIIRVLKPGGTMLLHPTSESKTLEVSNSSLERVLLLAGFLDVSAVDKGNSFGVVAKKASWIGSSFSLKKPAKTLPVLQIDDDDDLIDEDSLLTEDDRKKPELPVGDCEVGKTKKACQNCSCGRAEAEEKEKLGITLDLLDNPQSACGSCGLGDAFRCSSCPYKGLPKFELGQKITLSGNFLASDY